MDLRPALLALLLCAAQPGLHAATPLHMAPAPMLAMQMHDMVGVSAWLVSEKLEHWVEKSGFKPSRAVLEFRGLCGDCAKAA